MNEKTPLGFDLSVYVRVQGTTKGRFPLYRPKAYDKEIDFSPLFMLNPEHVVAFARIFTILSSNNAMLSIPTQVGTSIRVGSVTNPDDSISYNITCIKILHDTRTIVYDVEEKIRL